MTSHTDPLETIVATEGTTILSWDGTGFDANKMRYPTIVEVEGEFKLYYAGMPYNNSENLGLATSDDGINFTKYSDNQLIPEEDEPSWASFRFDPITVMYENGTYKMWFRGNDTNLFTQTNNTHGFGYATSTDGINWDIQEDPIRVESGAREGARLVEVVKHGDEYIAYYMDINPDTSNALLLRATSSDGINFDNDTVIGLDSEYSMTAATEANGVIFATVYKDGEFFLAQSTDGLDFEISHQLDFPESYRPEDIVIEDGTITFYGRLFVGDINWSWGNNVIHKITVEYNLIDEPVTYTGGKGEEEITGLSNDDVLAGGAGVDTVNGNGGDDQLDGGKGNDQIDGGSGKDVVTGGKGADDAAGGSGNDLLSGGQGDDLLNGGSGNDSISGGKGSDVIIGGAGDDELSGGKGADEFEFAFSEGGEGHDEILDFVPGSDSMKIEGADYSELSIFQDGESVIVGHGFQGGSPLEIENYTHTIALKGTDIATIGVDDFMFI